MAFLAQPGVALVRPLDYVLGYAVPDGGAAVPLIGLGRGGWMFAGPEPGQLWVEMPTPDETTRRMVVVDRRGDPTGTTATVPTALGIRADGAGGLLYTTRHGATYDVRGDGPRQMTTDRLLAVGRTAWLTMNCHGGPGCRMVVLDPTTMSRRALGPRREPIGTSSVGVVSPDGRTAAVEAAESPEGPRIVYLVDLRSGAVRTFPVGVSVRELVWSPDSRWLFATGSDGALTAIGGRTGALHPLGVSLPELYQIAVRSTSAAGSPR